MKARVAVLGCGSIGRRHLKNLRSLGHEDLLAYDPEAAARELTVRDLNLASFGTLEEIWKEKPDIALVTAPSNLHIELATSAARNNCHLFIEKPLSHSLQGVDELVEMTSRDGRVTMVGCNMRFHPGPATVKRLIDSGEAGPIISARIFTGSYLPGWRPWLDYRQSYSAHAEMGGGALLDCIHEIDLALWYFGAGQVVGAATRQADSLGIAVEGMAEVLIQHRSGVLTSAHLNFVQNDYDRGCQVIGEKGTIYWKFGTPVVEVRKHSGVEQYELDPAWRVDQMYVDEMAYFLGCVEAGTPTMSTLEHGKAALEIVLRAKELARANPQQGN